MTTRENPAFEIDEESKPFFDGLAAHEIRLLRCSSCGSFFFPPLEVCPNDFSSGFEWTAASGRGTLHSWAVMHQVYRPQLTDKVPYLIAQVELEEGPRMPTSLRNVTPEQLRIGLPLEAVYETVEGVELPFFRPRQP